MTKQEIFNKVVLHLLKQNVPSYSDIGNCAYRGRKGTMCAVGCLIPESEYKARWENNSVDLLVSDPDFGDFADMLESIGIDPNDKGNLKLLEALQSFHDATERTIFGKEPNYTLFRQPEALDRLDQIAMDFGLKFNVDESLEMAGVPHD